MCWECEWKEKIYKYCTLQIEEKCFYKNEFIKLYVPSAQIINTLKALIEKGVIK